MQYRIMFAALALLALAAGPALATDYVSVADGNWGSTSTWNPAGVPGQGDNVSIGHRVVLEANYSVDNLAITPGGKFVISGAYSAQVYGNWTNNGVDSLVNGFVFFTGTTDAGIGGDSATAFWRLRVTKDALARTVTLNQPVTCAYPGAGALAITRGTLLTNGRDLAVSATNASIEGDSTGKLAVTGSSTVNVYYLNQQRLRYVNISGTPTVNITNRHEMYGIYNVTTCSIFGGTVNYTRAGGQNLFLYVTQSGGWWALGGTVTFNGDIGGSMLTRFVALSPAVVRFAGSTTDTLAMLSASGGHIWSQWRIDDLRVEKTGGGKLVCLPNQPSGSTESDSSLFCALVRVDSGAGLHLGGTLFYNPYRAGYRFGELLNNGAMSQDANQLFLSGSWLGAGSFVPGTGTVSFIGAGSDTAVTNGSGFYTLVVKKPAGSLDVLGSTAAGSMLLDSAGAVRFADSLVLGTATVRGYVRIRDRVHFAGSTGDPAVVAAADPAHPYTFAVDSGATIGATWTEFHHPDTLGINIASGALVDTLANFSDCRFDHGDVTGPMLKVENAQVLSLNGPGTRWGEAFDTDPNDLVDWLGADAGVSQVLAPVGQVPLNTVVTPGVRLHNYGQYPATFDVTLQLADSLGAVVYDTTETGISLAAGDSIDRYFSRTWTAGPRGAFSVTAWTASGDPGNDTARAAFEVVGRDVGISGITAPAGAVPPGTNVAPAVRVTNYGIADAVTGVRLVLSTEGGTVVYDTLEEGVAVAAGATESRIFTKTWLAEPEGRYRVLAYTTLEFDINPANDTGRGSFQVGNAPPSGGWVEVTQVPLAPSGKMVKDGGWIAWDALTGKYYVSKGYKTGDFYSWDATSHTWTTLEPMPLGVEAKPPYKGSVGVSDGNGVIYATKGNNRSGFWKYTTDDSLGTWTQLADVPLGLSNKKVKGGTDLVYVQEDSTGYVYLLKGYKTEFYRYNVNLETWETLADAPVGVKAKYDKGSWLVHDAPNRTIYAHKAKYQELYAYSLDSMAWGPMLPGMPLANGQTGKNKKAKDGSDAVLIDGRVYTLKGGNTVDFYTYDLATMTWAEAETIPSFGTTGKKKRVKGGGSMTTDGVVLHALKGNKTLELWRFDPAAVFAPRPDRSGVMARQTLRAAGFSLGPNPLAGNVATLRYSLPAAGPASVRVFDISGRQVLTRTLGPARTGTLSLDLRDLSAGVYLVKLTSDGSSANVKLVIQ